MSDPQSVSVPTQVELEKRRDKARDLTRAYKRLFASTDGRVVLADLETRCAYNKELYSPGVSHADLAYRCGTQKEVLYIHEHLAKELPALGTALKKRSAKSGSTPPT